MVLIKGSKVAVFPAVAFNSTAHTTNTLLDEGGTRRGRRCLLGIWLRSLLIRLLVFLGWRKLVARMGFEVVALLNIGQVFVLLADLLRLHLPTVTCCLRYHLVVVLRRQLFGSVRVSRAVKHEGVHGPGNSTMPFSHLLHTVVDRTMHPAVHVTDGDVRQMSGRFAQWGADLHLGAFL